MNRTSIIYNHIRVSGERGAGLCFIFVVIVFPVQPLLSSTGLFCPSSHVVYAKSERERVGGGGGVCVLEARTSRSACS